MVRRAREITSKPLGINLLLHAQEDRLDEVLNAEPAVLSTAWQRDDQDLAAIVAKAHERGIRVMHMVSRVEDAVRAVFEHTTIADIATRHRELQPLLWPSLVTRATPQN